MKHLPLLLLLALFLLLPRLEAQQPTPKPTATPTPIPTPTPAATPPTTPPSLREAINGLKDEDLEKAAAAIKGDFLDKTLTDEKALRRAELEGLIRRLSPGVSIISTDFPARKSPDAPFLAEILDGQIGYLRIGALDKGNLSQMDTSLASFFEKRVPAVILDLRAVPTSGDFESAAEFARRFCAKGKLLFTLHKPSAKQERIFTANQDPAFSGILIVLTDADTSGAAEALVATLRINARAMIVGADTAGEAVEFLETPLGGNKILKVAVAQVTMPEGAAIFPSGVKPDIAISLSSETQDEIFSQSTEKGGVSQFVFEPERTHMNEAALVANQNPEIESSQSFKDRNKPPLRDSVLQRAVDLVTAISFYKGKS